MQFVEGENEGIERNDDADQSGDGKASEFQLKGVQKTHEARELSRTARKKQTRKATIAKADGGQYFQAVSAAPSPKSTPLFSEHVRLGAKIVEFGGWQMPVQYSGIMEEHHAVRNAVGVFDISHMGQFLVKGPEAENWLNFLLSNNVQRLAVGESQYTFLLNEDGGVIDDLIVYRYDEGKYLLVVNAAKTDEDFAWMEARLRPGVVFENQSAQYAGLAVQGPKSVQLFDAFFNSRHSRPARNEIKKIECDLTTLLISSTGYTGEDGFEVFFPAQDAAKVWKAILDRGAEFQIKPCGLGARDTLRLEMCYPLNGSDLSAKHTPLEAGLSIFVDLQKPDFVGREALLKQRSDGVKRRLVPFMMKEKCPPPRAHYPVFKDGTQIGEIASGTLSPTLQIGIGMAYVPTEFARINEEIEVDIRGRRFRATIEKKPLHRKGA
jgi:aminomethyltransferase